jgi:lipopolysaccharide assembly protein A
VAGLVSVIRVDPRDKPGDDDREAPMTVLFWTSVLLLATALALFAGSNREMVMLAWWPFGFVLELPLYLALFGAVVLGILIGAAGAWHAGRRWRREARRRRRHIAALERELAATQAQLPGAPTTPAPLPALLRRAG